MMRVSHPCVEGVRSWADNGLTPRPLLLQGAFAITLLWRCKRLRQLSRVVAAWLSPIVPGASRRGVSRFSAAQARWLMRRMASSWTSVGSHSEATPISRSSRTMERSHPQGHRRSSDGGTERNSWRAMWRSANVACSSRPVAAKASWAKEASSTSTTSPIWAHNAGRKPRSWRSSRAARGGVVRSRLAASMMSCSGLKIYKSIVCQGSIG